MAKKFWKSWLKHKSLFTETGFLAALTISFYALASRFDLHDRLHNFYRYYEWLEMEGLALTGVFLSILLVMLLLRRHRDLRLEITRRRIAEALSSEEKHTLQAIFDATPYGMVIIDKGKSILYANRAALKAMGYDHQSQVLGRICNDSFCLADDDKCPILDLGQQMDRSEKLLLTKDGTRIPILKTVVPFNLDGEKVLLEAFVDISEHKKSEALVRDILESIDEAFVVVDREFRILSANKAYCKQSKIHQNNVKGMPCYNISHGFRRPCNQEGEECPVETTFRTGLPHTTLHTHRNSGGENIYVEVKAYPLRDLNGEINAAVEIISDITDRLKLEEQLRHSQKMEAIGTLTGGVAHEFNNVITAIMGFSEFLQDALPRDGELRKYADYITSSANRAARLTQSLLAYSRKQITHAQPTDLNEVLETMGGFLRTLAGTRVELEMSLCEAPLVAVADASQIEQVIMNLTANSMEAMPDGGALSISSRSLLLSEAKVLNQTTIPPGYYALIRFSDTGAGIPETVMPKIFEPFFTTKDVGQGTGLGLAMVYGIVKKHDSFIDVESRPGKGTAFSLYIPLSGEHKPENIPATREEPRGGSETILLAEDDAPVRELMEYALKAAGYRVITAKNGREAVEAFHAHGEKVDLLLFDLSMPDMDGLKALEAIHRTEPGAQVLFVSGCLSGDMRTRKIKDNGYGYVLKPISPRELLVNVRHVLG